MQAGKSAMDAAKETVANIAASAKSGMEKTKAVIEEKVDRISTDDPVEKDMATLRKEDKIRQAELLKQEAYTQNAAAAAGGTEPYTAVGTVGSIMSQSGRIESHTTTGTESYSPTARYKDPASIVPGHGTTQHSSDHATEAPNNAGTAVGNYTAEAGGVPARDTRTGPEP